MLEWLLGLEGIRLGQDSPVYLRFASPWPGWLLFGLALVASILIIQVYRKERAPVMPRLMLGVCRALLIALVVIALCRPRLVLQRNRVEPSQVVLLLDSSRSMASVDRYADDALAERIARGAGLAEDGSSSLTSLRRLDLVRQALQQNEDSALTQILERNQLKICQFSDGLDGCVSANDIDDLPSLRHAISDWQADGVASDMPSALSEILKGARGRRLAAIVVASDGQMTSTAQLDGVLEDAQGRHIPIMPLRIGSTLVPIDVEVGPARVEPRVFVHDLVAVEVDIAISGAAEPLPLTVNLLNEATGEVVATDVVELSADNGVVPIELRTKPDRLGKQRYAVEVVPIPNETSLSNNRVTVGFEVMDDQLDVLYVEGYPRYEYRYLKNALLREKTINLSVLLLEADRRFVQEGVDPVRAFPDSPEALRQYDVLLFGDVDPREGWISDAQMRMVLDFVSHGGGGFALIAGERHAPHRFAGTPLEKLLPIRIDPSFLGTYQGGVESGFQMQLTTQGAHSRQFRYTATDADRVNKASIQDASSVALPEIYWYARVLGPKPGASVLSVHPVVRTAREQMPLLVSSRYGAGKTFFQGTDDTWRWRRHTGELFHDAYWVQLTRELMQGRNASRDSRLAFRTDRRLYSYGQAVRAQLEFRDAGLSDMQPTTLEVDVTGVPVDGDLESESAVAASPVLDRFELQRVGQGASLYEGVYLPAATGDFVLRVASLMTEGDDAPLATGIRVSEPNLEARRPEADHVALQQLAQATRGSVIEMDQLSEALRSIPNRSVQIPDDVVEPLWDSRLMFILFVLLLGAEWTTRKAWGLL
ncbi:MAG: hypothetical protein ACPGXK_02580 [Phycisphaerae bacterium]